MQNSRSSIHASHYSSYTGCRRPAPHTGQPGRSRGRNQRSRTVTFTELLLLGFFAAAIVVAGAHYLTPARAEVSTTASIRVGPQTTLWQIAQEYPIEGLSTAETVQVLVGLNEMEDASLVVGQALLVPVAGDSIETAVASR